MRTRRSASKKAENQGKTRAIAYVRVSTDEQAQHGFSLAAQTQKLAAYAELFDLELTEIRVEDRSAKDLRRPVLQAVLADLRAGRASALVVLKLDRLTRNVRDLGELISGYFSENSGVDLHSVEERVDTRSAAGRLVLNVLVSVAQWEREAIAERVSTVMNYISKSGGYVGGEAPYGKRLADGSTKGAKGQKLVDFEPEMRVIQRACELRAAGRSYADVAATLATEGAVSRSGRPFLEMQVYRMVRSAGQGCADSARAASP